MSARGISLWLLLCLGAGCSFHARDANSYRDATRALLESKNDVIKGCYDENLKKNEKVTGVVALKFKVEAKTGKLAKVQVDEQQTTAPKELTSCVVQALDGLTLDPPDQREGDASFSWEFQVQS